MNRPSYWGTRTTFENAWRNSFLTLVPSSVGDSTHSRRLFIYIFGLKDSMVTITILGQWLDQKPLLLCLEIASVKTIHIMGTMSFVMSFVGTFVLVTESSKPGEIKAIGTRGDLIRGAWETMCNLCVFFIQVENSTQVTSIHCGKVKNVLEATNRLNTVIVIAVKIVERSFLSRKKLFKDVYVYFCLTKLICDC